jgi:hypothetical protein
MKIYMKTKCSHSARSKIYFLEETWADMRHIPNETWTDPTVKHKQQIFLSVLSSVSKKPQAKAYPD